MRLDISKENNTFLTICGSAVTVTYLLYSNNFIEKLQHSQYGKYIPRANVLWVCAGVDSTDHYKHKAFLKYVIFKLWKKLHAFMTKLLS